MSIDNVVAIIDKNLILINEKIVKLRTQISPLEDEFHRLNDSRKRLTEEYSHSTESVRKRVIDYISNNPGMDVRQINDELPGTKFRTVSAYCSTLVSEKIVICKDRKYYPMNYKFPIVTTQ
jgi:hypothetical protein